MRSSLIRASAACKAPAPTRSKIEERVNLSVAGMRMFKLCAGLFLVGTPAAPAAGGPVRSCLQTFAHVRRRFVLFKPKTGVACLTRASPDLPLSPLPAQVLHILTCCYWRLKVCGLVGGWVCARARVRACACASARLQVCLCACACATAACAACWCSGVLVCEMRVVVYRYNFAKSACVSVPTRSLARATM